jgi:hypothetical protein
MGTPQEFALVRALAQLERGAPAELECYAFHVHASALEAFMEAAIPTRRATQRGAPQRVTRDMRVLQRVMRYDWVERSPRGGFVATVRRLARAALG